MKPEEKEAERLIELFSEVRELGFSLTDGQVKACAAICVEEIMKVLPKGAHVYWNKVIEQINKP